MHSHTPSLRMISARLRLGLAVAFCLCLGLGLVAISAGSSHLPTGLAPELTDSPASAERLERALESVMTLEILEQNAAGGWRLRDTAAAIVISSEGHVVTLHSGLSIALSASGQMKSQVRLRLRAADGQSYRAKWLGSDPELDLALLAILDRRGQSFQALPVKPERQPLLGESFVQILPRNPFRHQGQLIAGHCEQILPVLLSESGQHYALFTSASLINKSDLFAPAISRDGAVIGFSIYRKERVASDRNAYFISNQTFVEAVQRLHRQYAAGPLEDYPQEEDRPDAPHDSAQYGIYLGLRFYSDETFSLLQDDYGLPSGLMIAEVLPQSPAYVAGLNAGDIIVMANQEPIAKSTDFLALSYKLEPGDLLALNVVDELGNEREIQVYTKRP